MSSLSGVSSACQTQMMQGGPGCDGWIKISLNGTVGTSQTNIGGNEFEDLPVYAQAVSGAPRGAPGILDYIAKISSGGVSGGCDAGGAPASLTSQQVPIPTSVVQLSTVQQNEGPFLNGVYQILDSATGWTFSNCPDRHWFFW